MLNEAYEQICTERENAEACYVSLYCKGQCYGGPEEGGWWYNIMNLEQTQFCSTRSEAEALVEKINDKVEEMNKQARMEHGKQCLNELDYCEQRGIDDANSVFGEVDGPDEYVVVIEQYPGSRTKNETPTYC